MRLHRVTCIALVFGSASAIANARVVADEPAAAPHAVSSQPVTLTTRTPQRKATRAEMIVQTPTGHAHVALPELVVGRPDATDPWSGTPIDSTRTYAALDATDPWTGERVAIRVHAPIDTTDPWR